MIALDLFISIVWTFFARNASRICHKVSVVPESTVLDCQFIRNALSELSYQRVEHNLQQII